MAKRGKRGRRIRQGFRLTVILVFLVVLLALLAIVMILGAGGGDVSDAPATPTNAPASIKDFDSQSPQTSSSEPPRKEEKNESSFWDKISGALDGNKVKETEGQTYGIDVAKYQGTIDWAKVAESGVDFAMVRIGYRRQEDGEITADTNARYNLQEATKYGIKLGAYFFSTAISEEEAIAEADWVADFIAPYPITYPVAYNCENFEDSESRQFRLSRRERTDNAIAFLKQIEKRGYEGMFYASKNEMEADAKWQVSRIEPDYKIWVAQYPAEPYPTTEKSSYSGTHQMWQYTREGQIPGISQPVDVDIAYFGYDGEQEPQSDEALPEAKPDPEALMEFRETNQFVTAKEETNLRDIPSQDEDAQVLYTLKHGELARRTGVSDSGWSRVEFEGKTYYAVTSYLTTQIQEDSPAEPVYDPDGDGIETEFSPVSEQVTAKDVVNLRNIPSTTRADATIVGQLKNGDIATRTGTSENGWSRLDIDGTVCYAVSSYLTTDLTGAESGHQPGIQTQFREVSDTVTAKDVVNLRTLPSTEDPDCEIVGQLKKGDRVIRNGVNDDLGWSRVVFEGKNVYCVTRYLEVLE